MDHKTAEMLVEAAETIGIDVTLYENYSGRGMYNKTTTGVVGGITGLMAACLQAGVDNAENTQLLEEVGEDLLAARIDSMGFQFIIY